MQQRITNLWSNLVSFGNREDAEQHRIQQAPAEAAERYGYNLVAEYEHVSWTRLISMESWQAEQAKAWDLGNDIAAEFLLLNEVEDEHLEQLEPLFDPGTFQQEHPRPSLEQFRLT